MNVSGGGETREDPGGWTVDTLRQHYDALRASDQRFDKERDRRYSEVARERDRGQHRLEAAQALALQLQRENQTFKDEKANQLREQIGSERGLYPTKDEMRNVVEKVEASIKPLTQYVSRTQGSSTGVQGFWGYIVGAVGVLASLVTLAVLLSGHLR